MAPHYRLPKLKFPKKVREIELVKQNEINGLISYSHYRLFVSDLRYNRAKYSVTLHYTLFKNI